MPTGEEHDLLDEPRPRPDGRSIAVPIGMAISAGAIPTVAIFLVDDLRFVYEGAQLRSALDTAQCLIGALVAYLLYGRFRRTGLLNDLSLSYALGLSAATNLFFAAVPAVVGDLEPTAFTTWAPLTARTLSAAVIAWAALTPDRPYASTREPGASLAAALAGTIATIALVFWRLADDLPDGVERSLTASASGRPRLEGEPVLLVAQLLLMGLFVAASAGFARRANIDTSSLTRALAAACVLNAFARLNYFLYPSLYTDIVHTGDVLRLGYFLVLLVGATGEINRYWVAQTQAAAAAERRRMARDLHDGLTQELTFIRAHTVSLAAGRDDPRMLEHVADAAGRALDQSRRAVEALTSPAASLHDALDAALEGLPEAYGATVELDIADVRLGAETSATMAWIARESVSNALRHGRARRVTVAAQRTREGVRLSVVDDGTGFSADLPRPVDGAGFGLRSMRERAELLGGELVITSEPDRGTTIEVRVPRRSSDRQPG